MRARLCGDFGTGQHPGDFFLPPGGIEQDHRSARDRAFARLGDHVMLATPRRDLRAVGNGQQLAAAGEPRQSFANRAGDRAANAAVDIVTNTVRRMTCLMFVFLSPLSRFTAHIPPLNVGTARVILA